MASRLARIPPSLSRIRTMSSAAARKYEFLVIVPDRPGMLAKRLEVRSYVRPPASHSPDLGTDGSRQHFSNMAPKVESGEWKMGGASCSMPL